MLVFGQVRKIDDAEVRGRIQVVVPALFGVNNISRPAERVQTPGHHFVPAIDDIVAIIPIEASDGSIQLFWFGIILIFVFAYHLGWLPPSGTGDEGWVALVLPVIALGLRPASFIARVTRSSMLLTAHSV